MNTMPAVGVYLMPVQAYQVMYCHQVLEVIDCTKSHGPGMKCLRLKRWGLDERRQPFNDGHCDSSHDSWTNGTFKPVGTQAWRIKESPPWCGLGPIYFKQMPAPAVAGQLDLFL